MKSICIKTNNSNLLDYLLQELNYLEIDNVCFSCNQFKSFKNIIIHYTGLENDVFIHEISCILSCLVIDELEENIFKNLIQKNYFYFSKQEQNSILNICFETLSEDYNLYFNKKYNLLIDSFKSFFKDNKSIVLSGFINFRLKNYYEFLEEIIDEAVNAFIIEKEYVEFISLLKLYINSEKSTCDLVHLIYNNDFYLLLDENKNIINVSDDIFKAKYLSDITFSSNDYILNGLLTLLPQKIYIHLIDKSEDEFINTLQLIFQNRIEICHDCNICKIYKANKTKNHFIKN